MVELRIHPEPGLSGLSLACLLGLEEEMGRKFQARNFGDHRQGTMKPAHPNRAECVAQKICPSTMVLLQGSAPGKSLGSSVREGVLGATRA